MSEEGQASLYSLEALTDALDVPVNVRAFVVAVPDCNPRIDELDRLVMKLNSNESLSEFTAAVRKAWSRECRQA